MLEYSAMLIPWTSHNGSHWLQHFPPRHLSLIPVQAYVRTCSQVLTMRLLLTLLLSTSTVLSFCLTVNPDNCNTLWPSVYFVFALHHVIRVVPCACLLTCTYCCTQLIVLTSYVITWLSLTNVHLHPPSSTYTYTYTCTSFVTLRIEFQVSGV